MAQYSDKKWERIQAKACPCRLKCCAGYWRFLRHYAVVEQRPPFADDVFVGEVKIVSAD